MNVSIVSERLSDGSEVYDVRCESTTGDIIRFACDTKGSAEALAAAVRYTASSFYVVCAPPVGYGAAGAQPRETGRA